MSYASHAAEAPADRRLFETGFDVAGRVDLVCTLGQGLARSRPAFKRQFR